MSPRAACRLDQLGYDVADYAAGKDDWAAADLPLEAAGHGPSTIGGVCRRDVPSCGVDDRIGDVAAAVANSGFDTCLVVAADRCVVGRLFRSELRGDPQARTGDVMRPGPSTFRPSVPIAEMLAYMREHELRTAPVTTGDGILVGLLLRRDLEEAHEQLHQAHA